MDLHKVGLGDLPPLDCGGTIHLVRRYLFIVIKIRRSRCRRRYPNGVDRANGRAAISINYSTVLDEQYIASGLAAVLQATITVFGLILDGIFTDERITPQKIIAVVIGIVGVAVIFNDQLRVENWLAFAGCVAIVIGSYCAAQASVLIKAKAAGIHPASLVFCQMICGLPAIVIYSLIQEGDPFSATWSLTAIVCVVYLAVFGTVAAFWLYYWLLERVESTKAMTIALVTPLLAVVIGNVTIGETLPPLTFFGGR